MSNACKSPSKFLSLSFLKEVQGSYYMSVGGINYEASEVDMLIAEKEDRLLELADKAEYCPDDFLILEDDNEIAFPSDLDFVATVSQIELIPNAILNEIAELFTTTINVVRKAVMAVTKMAKMTAAKVKEIRAKAKKQTLEDANKIYDKTFDRGEHAVRFQKKPGRKVGELGKKRKIHLAIDPDLYVIASNTGNRSRFINTAIRHFTESKGFRDYVALLEHEDKNGN